MSLGLEIAPHDLLGVRPDASLPEITRARRRLARRYHPDLCHDKQAATAALAAINAAYDALLHARPPQTSAPKAAPAWRRAEPPRAPCPAVHADQIPTQQIGIAARPGRANQFARAAYGHVQSLGTSGKAPGGPGTVVFC